MNAYMYVCKFVSTDEEKACLIKRKSAFSLTKQTSDALYKYKTRETSMAPISERQLGKKVSNENGPTQRSKKHLPLQYFFEMSRNGRERCVTS